MSKWLLKSGTKFSSTRRDKVLKTPGLLWSLKGSHVHLDWVLGGKASASLLAGTARSQGAPLLAQRAEEQGCGSALTFLEVTQERGIKLLEETTQADVSTFLTAPRSRPP